MNRQIMINEIGAAVEEMGGKEMETPSGLKEMADFRKKVKKMDTKRLEVLHRNTIEKYEVWTKEQDLLAKMYEKWTVEPKEKEMAKAPKVEEKVEVVETIERKALKALFFTVLAKEDRPDTTDWTDAQVEEELKENIELLSPGDMETVKGMEDGEAIWEYFVSLFPALAPKQPAPKEKKSKESSEPPVEKKIPNSTKFVHIICDEFVATDDKIVPADVKKKFADGGGKLSESMQDAWIADALKILRYLRATDRLK